MPGIETLALVNGLYNTINQEDDSQKQQEYNLELMDKQYQYNQKGADAQMEREKEMYEYTGYASKVRQLKDAGLNPGLVYGMGGSGGGTTGNITAANVGLPSAPNVAQTTANKTAQTGMLLQLAKMKSEIELNQSQAAVNKAEAGVKETTVPKITAETTLIGEQTIGQNIKNSLDKISLTVKDQTKYAEIDQIISLSEKAYQEMLQSIEQTSIAEQENKVAKGTTDTKIKSYQANYANTLADTAVAWSQKSLNQQEESKLRADITNIAATLQLKQGDQKIQIESLRQEMERCLINNAALMDRAKLEGFMNMVNKLIPGRSINKIK